MSLEAPIKKADGWFIGEDKTLAFTVVDQNAPRAGGIDVTGWTMTFVLSDLYSGDSILEVEPDITDPENGGVDVTIPGELTVDLTGDTDYWYVLRRLDLGARDELAFGKAYLRDVWVNYEATS